VCERIRMSGKTCGQLMLHKANLLPVYLSEY
jgi:hypothetical protein